MSLHRLLFRNHLKPETVSTGDRIVKVALGMVGLVMVGVVLLVFDVVTTRGAALAVAGAVGLGIVVAWLVAPMRVARRKG